MFTVASARFARDIIAGGGIFALLQMSIYATRHTGGTARRENRSYKFVCVSKEKKNDFDSIIHTVMVAC